MNPQPLSSPGARRGAAGDVLGEGGDRRQERTRARQRGDDVRVRADVALDLRSRLRLLRLARRAV